MKRKVSKLLTCPYCGSENVEASKGLIAKFLLKFGKMKFRCVVCGRRWSENP